MKNESFVINRFANYEDLERRHSVPALRKGGSLSLTIMTHHCSTCKAETLLHNNINHFKIDIRHVKLIALVHIDNDN